MEAIGGSPPPPGANEWVVEQLREQVRRYNTALADVERLQVEAEKSELELTLAMIAPFLITVAIALRITKVTGEIRLDRSV